MSDKALDLFMRQLDLLPPMQLENFRVCFVGGGGIGSWAVLGTAKMGVPHITVLDPDVVEEHNQPNQLYPIEAIGALKAQALATLVRMVANTELTWAPTQVTPEGPDLMGFNVVVSGVDSMESRRAIWAALRSQLKEAAEGPSYYIDGRMGAQVLVCYAVPLDDEDACLAYEATLAGDGVEEPCTARAIIYTAMAMAGFICDAIKRVAREEVVPAETMFDFVTRMYLGSRGRVTTMVEAPLPEEVGEPVSAE